PETSSTNGASNKKYEIDTRMSNAPRTVPSTKTAYAAKRKASGSAKSSRRRIPSVRSARTFNTMNKASSLSPLHHKRRRTRGSSYTYFDRYTWETRNPVMKMNEGVRNRRYR